MISISEGEIQNATTKEERGEITATHQPSDRISTTGVWTPNPRVDGCREMISLINNGMEKKTWFVVHMGIRRVPTVTAGFVLLCDTFFVCVRLLDLHTVSFALS